MITGAESNLLDVVLALEAGSAEGPPPFAELMQLMQVQAAKLPANLLPGGPLSAGNAARFAPAAASSAPAARTALPAAASSGGREYREIAGFLPTLPPRHTFIGNDAPSLAPDVSVHNQPPFCV